MSISDLSEPLLNDGKSTTSGSSASSTSSLVKKPVWCSLSERSVGEFKSDYLISPITQKGPPHLHPHLHYQRCYLENHAFKFACKLGSGYVLDVGSAPARALRFDRVRCLVPQLQPGDASRLAGFNGHPRVCQHTLNEYMRNVAIPSCGNCLPCDTAVFIHSGYYFNPQDYLAILNVVKYHTCFVVGHKFDSASGGLARGEANYNMRGDKVVMRVLGNNHTYSHPLLPWNDTDHFTVENTLIEVALLQRLGDTYLWRLETTTIPPIVVHNDKPWDCILLDITHQGPIVAPPLSKDITSSIFKTIQISFPLDRLTGNGNTLICTGSDDVQIIVPRGLIAHIAVNCVLRPRDPALIRDAVHYAKNYLARAPMPTENSPTVIAVAVVLGICCNVMIEARLMQHAVTHYAPWWRSHAQLLSLIPLKVYSIWRLLLTLMTTFAVVIVLDHYVVTPSHMILIIGLVVYTLITAISFLLYWYQQYKLKRSGESWISELQSNHRTSHVEGVVPLTTQHKFNGSVDISEPPIMDEGATIAVGVDPKPPKTPGNPLPRLINVGITPDTRSLTVFEPNQAGEEAMIRHRVVRKLQKVELSCMELYEETIDSDPEFAWLKEIKIKDDERLFLHWLKRYPLNVREKLIKARQRIQELGVQSWMAKLSAFMKLEKKDNVGLDGTKKSKPRAIQNPRDEIKVATGPFIHALSDELCKYWTGVQNNIMYTRGMSAEDIREPVQAYINYCGGIDNVLLIEIDFAVYDSSIELRHKAPFRAAYVAMGANPTTMQAISFSTTSGKTRHGVKYSASTEQINSGENETNMMGSMINAAAHVSFPKLSNCQRRFLMLVQGDDNALLLQRSQFSDQDVSALRLHLEGLALTPTMFIRSGLAKFEFCSKLFWPCSGGLILSPKPGRLIIRLAYVLTNAGAANLKGMILSVRQDTAHIPFVAPLVKRYLELIDPKLKAKFSRNVDEWMYHTRQVYSANDDTYSFLYDRYGLSRQDEEEFVTLLKSVTSLPTLISSRAVDRLIEVDGGDLNA